MKITLLILFVLFQTSILTAELTQDHPADHPTGQSEEQSAEKNADKTAEEAPRQADADFKPNGFDVSFSNIDTTKILQGGPPRDGIPAIDSPTFTPANKTSWLEADDTVVGVLIDGEARAYPLKILQYHECVNDTIGKVHFAVTYCPLCQSSFVFDRSFGDAVYDFGTSGMLWNSNVLLYDRQTESLWSQAAMKAVAGEAAKNNLSFTMLPATLSTWKEWSTLHPTTIVLSTNTGHQREYSKVHYASYFASPKLWFDVDNHLSNPREFAAKEEMLLVQVGKGLRLYSINELIETGGTIIDNVGKTTITIDVSTYNKTASVRGTQPNATMYWFAASACLPDATLWSPPNDELVQEIE